MRSSPRKPVDDLAELRRLINQPERDQRGEIQDRLDDKEQRAHEIASVRPEAPHLTSDPSAELSRALQTAAAEAVAAPVPDVIPFPDVTAVEGDPSEAPADGGAIRNEPTSAVNEVAADAAPKPGDDEMAVPSTDSRASDVPDSP
mgnify:CR=1 FL=1